jgi:prepilin-type N-terminal cleavage/methylation domain-containing protein/prepilin-type processing-associated H-X9-DG protein
VASIQDNGVWRANSLVTHSFVPTGKEGAMRRSRPAFTLIELLVVIAIIAIIAAILFPVFAQARAKARSISCLSSIKQWGTATFMYTQDYDERFPRFFREMPGFRPTSTYNQSSGFHPGGLYWHEAILPYIKNQTSLLCQQAQGALNPFCLPYGWNWAFVHDNSSAEYPFPAETLVIADGRGRLTAASDRSFCTKNQAAIGSVCADCLDEGKYIYGHGLVPPAAAATKPESVRLDANWSISPRHQGKGNVVFMDGHAKAMDAETLNRCNNWWDGDGSAGDCRVGAKHPRYSLAYR